VLINGEVCLQALGVVGFVCRTLNQINYMQCPAESFSVHKQNQNSAVSHRQIIHKNGGSS
jgi:hypothetical protein